MAIGNIFNIIPEDTFLSLIRDVGVLMFDFDPEKDKFDLATVKSKIAYATTGGIQLRTKPEYLDLGADIDNCPNNMAELKTLSGNGWDCGFSTTATSASPNVIKFGLAAADIDESVSTTDENITLTKITPRTKLKLTDFRTVTWACHTMDGGFAMAVFRRALSTDGFSMTTQKNTTATFALNVTAHQSIKEQDKVPVDYYYMKGEESEDTMMLRNDLAESFVNTGTDSEDY